MSNEIKTLEGQTHQEQQDEINRIIQDQYDADQEAWEIKQAFEQTRAEAVNVFGEFNKRNGEIYTPHDQDMFVAGYLHGVMSVAMAEAQEEEFKNA
jgi:hypothetical protein